MMNKALWKTWNHSTIDHFQSDFLHWYELEKRNLPWRVNLDPYRIWISEIMLQQTRVDTVIDYFYRFMDWFPTIYDLANAPDDKLLKAWEGLGYYSRARNLKIAAQQILTDYDGKMPDSIDEIRKLKGIGPYTAGAIGSIAYHLPEPAIDGNIIRVVSRLFKIDADITKANSRKIFDEAMRTIMDKERPGDFNQAMMDLGSAICTPKTPKCESCPIQAYCFGFKDQSMLNYPVKTKKSKPKDVYYIGTIIENKNKEFLIEQRGSEGLLANMWLFPIEEISKQQFTFLQKNWVKETVEQLTLSIDKEEDILVAEEIIPEILAKKTQVVWQKRSLGEVTHVFSHLKWHILVFYGRLIGLNSNEDNQLFVTEQQFNDFVFPKSQKKMIELLKKQKK